MPGWGSERLAIRWWTESSQDGASASPVTVFSEYSKVNRFFSMPPINNNNGVIRRN
jgi:hypothetical protein